MSKKSNIFEGSLKKATKIILGKEKWDSRYFTISATTLAEYTSFNKEHKLCYWSLSTVGVISPLENSKKFKIFFKNGQELVLMAIDEFTGKTWIKKMQMALEILEQYEREASIRKSISLVMRNENFGTEVFSVNLDLKAFGQFKNDLMKKHKILPLKIGTGDKDEDIFEAEKKKQESSFQTAIPSQKSLPLLSKKSPSRSSKTIKYTTHATPIDNSKKKHRKSQYDLIANFQESKDEKEKYQSSTCPANKLDHFLKVSQAYTSLKISVTEKEEKAKEYMEKCQALNEQLSQKNKEIEEIKNHNKENILEIEDAIRKKNLELKENSKLIDQKIAALQKRRSELEARDHKVTLKKDHLDLKEEALKRRISQFNAEAHRLRERAIRIHMRGEENIRREKQLIILENRLL